VKGGAFLKKYKVKTRHRRKHNGELYEVGDEFFIEKDEIEAFPEEQVTIVEVEAGDEFFIESDELEGLGVEELYEIMQELDINPRTKIREQGKDTMIKAIQDERGGEQ
jgi:hypothetical protein